MVTQVSNRSSLSRRFLSLTILLAVMASSIFVQGVRLADAQQKSGALPKSKYYHVFDEFYSGEFRSVQSNLKSLSRGSGNIIVSGRFLDSVCYWTMLGESHYRLGEYALALEQYEAALNLYMSLQQWPERTRFPSSTLEDQGATRRAAAVTWGISARTPRYGAFRERLFIRLGNTPAENARIARDGGTIDLERLQSLDVAEVMRCVSLAVYRSHMIKGPIAKVDPFTNSLAVNMAGAGGGSMQGAWTGIPKGLALAAKGDYSRAVPLLTSSLQIGGFDHPLTSFALLALGKIAVDQGKPAQAQQFFMEASIAAAAFEQFDIVAEALEFGAIVHASGRTLKPYQPLVAAIDWARTKNKDTLQASLLTTAAMVAAESGDAQSAERLLNDAKREMNRNDIKESSIYTRWQYVTAMVAYLNEDRNANKKFVEFQQSASATSLWLFQIAVADNAVKDNVVTEREGERLYDLLLGEPNEGDWKYRPDETMAFLTTPHYEPMERWFVLALSGKAEEKAIGIAELIRRQRFFSSLPMGGRLLSLRWVLEAPEAALSETAKKQKEGLLTRYTEYKTLSDQGAALRAQLEELPIMTDPKTDDGVKQKALMAELSGVVSQQEKFLRKIALVREPCELSFPQPLSIPSIQQKMKAGQVIISFLKVGRVYYVMKVTGGSYSIESQFQAKEFDRKVLQLTKALNVGDKKAVLDPDLFLDEDKWKKLSRELSKMIFAKTPATAIDEMTELIIIPDGKAWYLPMEILQIGPAEESVNLSDKVKIRYAPMAALTVPDERKVKRFIRSGLIADRNFIKDNAAQIAQGVADMQSAIPEMEQLQKTFNGPSAILGSTFNQLVVWHMSSEKDKRLLNFSPFQMDTGRPGSGLGDWMALPWQGIDQMVMPGVSSEIEGSTRPNSDGSEMFLWTTAMMASGSRTVLISRWRVGGQTTLDLTREFVQELGSRPAIDAWQRSVGLLKDSEIDNAKEPRLRVKVLDQPMTGKHPFFWSGYMLLDSGHEPPKEAANDAGSVADPAVGTAGDK